MAQAMRKTMRTKASRQAALSSRLSRERFQKIFPALGTVNSVTVYDRADVPFLDEIKNAKLEMDDLFSIFKADSEISAINRSSGIAAVHAEPRSIDIVKAGRHCGSLTGGAFDITSAPLTMIWTEAIRSRRLPGEAEIENALPLVGWENIDIDDDAETIFLTKRGAAIDLGGIAKGFAADIAAEKAAIRTHLTRAKVRMPGLPRQILQQILHILTALTRAAAADSGARLRSA